MIVEQIGWYRDRQMALAWHAHCTLKFTYRCGGVEGTFRILSFGKLQKII